MGFVGGLRISGLVESDDGVFTQRNAYCDNLFCISPALRVCDQRVITFCAKSAICCRTKEEHPGWYNIGKLHGSRKVISCASRGKKSRFRTRNCKICSLAMVDLSIRCRRGGGSIEVHRRCACL